MRPHVLLCLALLTACGQEAPEARAQRTEEQLRTSVEGTTDAHQRTTLLEQHIADYPDSFNGHLWLARIYRDKADERAVATFERAIAIDPSNPVARVELAYFLLEPALRTGRDPSREELERAEALVAGALAKGDCETRHHAIGVWQLQVEQGFVAEGAGQGVLQSLEACPDAPARAQWKAILGRIHQIEGRADEARTWLCEAVTDGDVHSVDECVELSGKSRRSACDALLAGAAKVQDKAWKGAAERNECPAPPTPAPAAAAVQAGQGTPAAAAGTEARDHEQGKR